MDAGALAGVQKLPGSTATAISDGCDYATNLNGVAGMFGEVNKCANSKAEAQIKTTYFANDTIKVTARKTIHPIFGWAVGFGDIKIGASATALVGSPSGVCGAPFFQTVDLLQAAGVWGGSSIILNKLAIMKMSEGRQGNFLALDLPGMGPGANWRDALGHPTGCTPAQHISPGDTLTTEPGNMAGPFDQGMSDRQMHGTRKTIARASSRRITCARMAICGNFRWAHRAISN